MMALPSSISLFLGSFALVFLLVLQQHAVHHQKYLQAFINALAIGSLNLLAIRLGATASGLDVFAFLCGGASGTVTSMWAREHLTAGAQMHIASLRRFMSHKFGIITSSPSGEK